MDAYPSEYVLHNLPFILLSGLGVEPELDPPTHSKHVLPGRAVTSVASEISALTGDRAQQLLQEFLSAEGGDAPWNARGVQRGNRASFRFRAVGRDFQFPPKKADPPTSSGISPPSSPTVSSAPVWILHSPISPLTPGSPIYPDGVIAPSWVSKHQHHVPAVFMSFFAFGSDPNTNSLHDNQLKTEINKIKGQIQKADYRTRYAVVLVSDKSVLDAPDTEERLATIRRATGLDPKNSLFLLPPNTSSTELRSFVTSVLSAVHPLCVEYYRDLTKHARRKKGRGTVPPPTIPPTRGTSQTLSHPGWNVRYDFKLGVFAEFRQEMDAAQRHYNIALDSLFGSEGIFETTASWLPRWDEIRLLADTVALRHIRCLLWNSYPTSAVQSWLRYRTRLSSLLDRRGKGTSNYGWAAWESRWAQIMAELIQRCELPVFRITTPISKDDPLVDGVNVMYSLPEKQIPMGERLPPWELLHHAGYWFKLSADHAKRRFIIARDIPEEDRSPPGKAPATRVSNRNQMYDLYLVPETHLENPVPGSGEGFQHWKDIVEKSNASLAEFHRRGQRRKVEQLQLEISRTLLYEKQYEEAFKVLRPLWETMTWRQEGWWSLASEVLWSLHECALRVQDPETYVATEWELYSKVFPGKSKYKHDLMGCLDSFQLDVAAGQKPSISLSTTDFLSCLSTTFTFSEGEGNVGEQLPCQIAITSNARPESTPITLSSLAFQFNGSLGDIYLVHETDRSGIGSESTMTDCSLDEEAPQARQEQRPKWNGTADLTLHPGQTKVFNFPITFREAGDIDAIASIFEINTDHFDLVCSTIGLETEASSMWWLKGGSRLKSRRLNRSLGTSVKVLPKPPKMDIQLPDLRTGYYTDEQVKLDIVITNKEDEDTEAVLEVRLLGRSKDTLGYSWVGKGASSPSKEIPPSLDGSDLDLPGHHVGLLVQGRQTTETIQFKAPSEPSDYVLEVRVLYHVLSDRDIPISKTSTADLVFNGPFEANFEFTPRVHDDPWPSYFALREPDNSEPESAAAFGIASKWLLSAKLASFAEEDLVVGDVGLEVVHIHGGATLNIAKETEAADVLMKPQDMNERAFCLDLQKMDIEDRRPSSVDMSLVITWQRSDAPGEPAVTSSLPIPSIQIPSSEPRVLASARRSANVPSLIHMDYTLENPTMHFLTFELSMEASEEFGFSGPKLRALNLLPMSRQTVRYNILPIVKGDWVTPQFKVVDRYFNKTLKVLATDGLKTDKKGVGVWVEAEAEEE
ncbi:hypothetical protein EJ04DRAFT_579327 [Polyplosphaeria fusca]|uniref:Trafficking protein particle complex subunit 11 n=1 Tax=Polyplosphaeria fusca TaxID=682080 RepID=A0A9P4QUG4_9PLEO|nr:hypothetical protein EJ04DRAFT_579327 [Polyplosphaeria fusca]